MSLQSKTDSAIRNQEVEEEEETSYQKLSLLQVRM